MKIFTKLASCLLIGILSAFFSTPLKGQSVINPSDTMVEYDAANPPTQPPYGQIGKWVRTKRISAWVTDSYKAYFYKSWGFRLKFPKSYNHTAVDGKTYPIAIMFHGKGEAASIYDNEYCLLHGGRQQMDAVDQGRFDGFIFYMQGGQGWDDQHYDAVAEILDYMVVNNKLDPFRVSVHGLSAGGAGAWGFMVRQPKYAAAGLPMSGTHIDFRDPAVVQSLKFTSIWDFQGGLDGNPAPYTSLQVYNAFVAAGGNMKHTVYPTLGHGTWNTAYAETDFFPYMLRANKANPWALGGRTQFCPGDPINITLGVTAGFDQYEWRKDGVLLPNTGNTLQVTSTGVYDCRIRKGTVWSAWSPIPANVHIKAITYSPTPQVFGLMSKVLPTPETNSVTLKIPQGFASYTWQKVGNATTIGTDSSVVVSSPGQYRVKITEQFGCTSEWSEPFTVVDAAGPNKPDAAINATVTTLSKTSLRLNWSDNPSPAYNETNFEVYQASEAGGNYKLIAIKDADVLTHTITGLDAKTTYFYKVRAVNNTAAANLSNEASGTTAADLQAPTAPTNLLAVSSTRTSVSLMWTAATDDIAVTKYDIYVNGQRSYVVTSGTAYTVQGLETGQSYNFSVRARDLAGNASPFSNQVTGQTINKGFTYKYYTTATTWSVLPDFKTLTPTVVGGTGTISLAPRTQNEKFGFLWEGYINITVAGTYIFRTTSDEGSKLYLGALGQTTSPYSHTATPLVDNDGTHTNRSRDGSITLVPGLYPIAVTYFQAAGSSSMSVSWRLPGSNQTVTIPASAFVEAPLNNGTAPLAPANLKATPVSYKRIDLSWLDKSNNETGFEIWRSSTSETAGYSTVGIAPANATSFVDTLNLAASSGYYYQIRAIGQYGESELVSNGISMAYWKFNNDYSNAAGISDRNLLPNGSPQFEAADKVEGTHSINLDGSNGTYLDLNNPGYLQGVHNERSIVFWMKAAATNNNRLIVEIGGSDDGLALRLNGNQLIAGVASNNSRATISAPYNYSGWKHVALVYKGNTLTLYIDGNVAASNNSLSFSSIGATTSISSIGNPSDVSSNAFNSNNNYNPFNGRLDDFAIYPRALSAEAVTDVFNNSYGLSAAMTLPLPGVPAGPTGLVATGISKSSIQINWADNANNETGYELYRSGNDNSNYLLLTTLPANTTSFTDEGLFANSVFYYKIRAVNVGGPSGDSNEDSARTGNNAPVITAIPAQSMRYGTQLVVNVQSTDQDAEPLDVAVTGLPGFGVYASNGNGTGTITFNPASTDQGTYNNITVTVTDQHQGSVSTSFNLLVNDNYIPVIGAVNNVTLNESATSQLKLGASDQNEADDLTWTINGLPAFAALTINGDSAFINLTPGYTDHGTYNVSATVSDGHGGIANSNFTITVNQVNPNKKYYINFTPGSASNVLAGVPWNNASKVAPAQNDNYANLLDDAGMTSAIGFTITSPWQNIFNASSTFGMNTGNNSGVYPDAVLRSSWYTTSFVQTIRFYGLDVNTKYNFTFLGSRTGTAGENRTAIYTINGTSVSLNAVNNTTNTVSLNDLQPAADGSLILSLQRATGATYAHINSVVIEAIFNNATIPAAPRSLAASMQGTQVKLNWVDAAYNESAYEVYRAANIAGPYTLLNAGANNENAEQYIDGNVAGNTLYYYTVRAINTTGASAFSDTVSITTANTSPVLANIANVNMVTEQVLDVPVSATDDAGDIITLSASNLPAWASFTDNGNGNGVIHLAPGFALGTVTGLTITATDNQGAAISKQFNVTVTPSDPNAPINLVAVGASSTSIKLTWTDQSNSETGYVIYRSNASNGTFNQIGTVGANVSTFTDPIGSGTTIWYYKVRASLGGGNYSGYSNTSGAAPVLSQLYVNFNDVDAAGAPWNNTNVGPIDGTVFSNLINDANISSGVNMTVEGTGFSGVNHSGMNTGNNSGIYPDNVINQSWFLDRGNVGYVRIDGLNLAHAYTFTFFGSRDGNGTSPDRTSKFTIGGVSDSINAINNISNVAVITNVKPDENGSVLVAVEAGGTSPYAYLGAMVIQAYSSATAEEGESNGGGSLIVSSTAARVSGNNNDVTSPVDISIVETKNKITAFPNPFTTDLSVRLSLSKAVEKLTVTVTDIAGRTVFTKEMSHVPQGTSQIKLGFANKLAPGMYLISLIGIDNKPVVVKALKNR